MQCNAIQSSNTSQLTYGDMCKPLQSLRGVTARNIDFFSVDVNSNLPEL